MTEAQLYLFTDIVAVAMGFMGVSILGWMAWERVKKERRRVKITEPESASKESPKPERPLLADLLYLLAPHTTLIICTHTPEVAEASVGVATNKIKAMCMGQPSQKEFAGASMLDIRKIDIEKDRIIFGNGVTLKIVYWGCDIDLMDIATGGMGHKPEVGGDHAICFHAATKEGLTVIHGAIRQNTGGNSPASRSADLH